MPQSSIKPQCRPDPFGIPACFYWNTDEVADWIESIGYGKYKENFRSHFINGRRLLTIDACALPSLGIVHFGDILEVASCIKNVVGKGPRVPSLNQASALSLGGFHSVPQHMRPTTGSYSNVQSPDHEYICTWGSWFPEMEYSYQHKERPIGVDEFEAKWRFINYDYTNKCKSVCNSYHP